jgi:hypothetical protein
MMRGLLGSTALVGCLCATNALAVTSAAYDSAVTNAGNRLVTIQQPNGNWTGEPYTGPTVAGLAESYKYYGTPTFKSAAQLGADYIRNTYTDFVGEESYAMTLVSDLQPTPGSNVYRTAASNYYSNVAAGPGGTNGKINNLVTFYHTNYSDSEAVIDLAYHTMAAAAVNAADKNVWRNRLIGELGEVDDNDLIPVGSLGAATWALALTGNGLDGTPITGSSTELSGKTLSQLPAELESQIIPSGSTAGAVYYDFAHTDATGYTEDLAMALMGLQAAADKGFSVNQAKLLNGRTTLAGAVEANGQTHFDVGQVYGPGNGYPNYSFQAGRLLEAVPEPGSGLIFAAAFGVMSLVRRRRAASSRA